MATCGGCFGSRIEAFPRAMGPRTQADPDNERKSKKLALRKEVGWSGARTFIGAVTGTRYRFNPGEDELTSRLVYEEDVQALVNTGFFAGKSELEAAELKAPEDAVAGDVIDPTPAALRLIKEGTVPPKGTTTVDLAVVGETVPDADRPKTVDPKTLNLPNEAPNRGPEPPNVSGKNFDDGGKPQANATGEPAKPQTPAKSEMGSTHPTGKDVASG